MGFPTAFLNTKARCLRQRAFSMLVIRLGFEPKTHSLEGCCSIQLSYRTNPPLYWQDSIRECKGRQFFRNSNIISAKAAAKSSCDGLPLVSSLGNGLSGELNTEDECKTECGEECRSGDVGISDRECHRAVRCSESGEGGEVVGSVPRPDFYE